MLNIEEIGNAVDSITEYKEFRPKQRFNKNEFLNLCNKIEAVFEMWSGGTYVGFQKDMEIQSAFQRFFVALTDLIKHFQNEKDNIAPKERVLAEKLVYHGKIYRYMGHGSSANCDGCVEPQYNEVFVSWSKEPENSYIETKLYGTMTWICAVIPPDDFGIDLSDFSRGKEHEIVFPTIKETICEIKYIERD